MHFFSVKTRALIPPKDNLFGVFDASFPKLEEGDILLITSKVVSIHEGRCVRVEDHPDKDALILQEAEHAISREFFSEKQKFLLTIKHSTVIPSSGIDESNANGYYILWPEDPTKSAKAIYDFLQQRYALKNFAVIITDSHTVPLRYGTSGISIGFWGMEPLRDYRGVNDIFGKELAVTQTNVVDPLAAAAVMLMGEAAERQPIVIARGVPHVQFTNENTHHKITIPLDEDLYAPLLRVFKKES